MNADQLKSSPELNVDVVEFERRQRQFLNELATKRKQVQQLKNDLGAANLKIHEQQRSLESAKSKADEQQYNLNLTRKNLQFMEEKLQSRREVVLKTQLQQEDIAAQKTKMMEVVQKHKLKHFELKQKVEELKAQHACDDAYLKELGDQYRKIRMQMTKQRQATSELQIGYADLLQISKKIDGFEEIQQQISYYRNEYYKLKQDYVALETKYIVAKATVDKFEELTAKNKDETEINDGVEFLIEQWEKMTKQFDEQLKTQNEIIQNLIEQLSTEKDASMMVFLNEIEVTKQNEYLKRENTELNDKLKQLTAESTNREIVEM